MSLSRGPHIALFPSAGMGHLTPFLRIASTLLSHDCAVTLITASPTVSLTESTHVSSFLSQHPQVTHVDFQLPSTAVITATTTDPFFLQFAAISRSAHLLPPILLSRSSPLPPLSAFFTDIMLASATAPVASDLGIPLYIVYTSSIRFLSIAAHLPELLTRNPLGPEVNVPGLTPALAASIIPPMLKDPGNPFISMLAENARAFSKAQGIIANSFEWFEPEALAFNARRASDSIPKVLPVGPLRESEDCYWPEKREEEKYVPWLDKQPDESVVYVSFGSRTAISRDQMRELSKGLEISGCRFVWVIKTSKVDRDDGGGEEEEEEALRDILGERTKERGLALRGWVRQKEILGHRAVGAFVSHCGWNSVMEAAWCGVRVVAWPQQPEQRANAELVERAGLGVWEKGWGGGGVVSGDEIGKKISEAMGDEVLRKRAKGVGDEAKKAVAFGGSSDMVIKQLLQVLSPNRDC